MKQRILDLADRIIRLDTDGEATCHKVTLHNQLVRMRHWPLGIAAVSAIAGAGVALLVR